MERIVHKSTRNYYYLFCQRAVCAGQDFGLIPFPDKTMKYPMLLDPKKAAIILLAMGWLLAASGQVVDGAGISAKNGSQKWNGTTKAR